MTKKGTLKSKTNLETEDSNLFGLGLFNFSFLIFSVPDSPFSAMTLNLGICIPRPCTTRQALNTFLNTDIASLGFEYNDNFCRLPNDKPWVAGDTVFV